MSDNINFKMLGFLLSEQQFFRQIIRTLTAVAFFTTDCRMQIRSIVSDCQVIHRDDWLVDGS